MLAVVSALAYVWLHGRVRPVERASLPYYRVVSCTYCKGDGRITCPECGGLRTVEATEVCPVCKGSGRRRSRFRRPKGDAPCPVCRGTGRRVTRRQCPRCGGTGYLPCPRCHGKGRLRVRRYRPTSRMGYSLCERILRFLRMPIASNPPPSRADDGSYPLLEEFFRANHKDGVEILNCTDFTGHGGAWYATAVVAVAKSHTSRTYTVEFVVRNRMVTACRPVQRHRPR